MKLLRKVLWAGCLSLLLLSLGVPSSHAQGGNPRINGFLRALATFPNIDSARTAYRAARFTDSERQLLEAALKDPAYRPHITRLAATINKSTFPSKPGIETTAARLPINDRTVETGIALAKEAPPLPPPVSAEARATTTLPKPVPSPRVVPPTITSVSRQRIEPGQTVDILGKDFMPDGRGVEFTFGSTVMQSRVLRWLDNVITVMLSPIVEGLPETRGKLTVIKQGFRVDRPIIFVPKYESRVIQSDSLTPISHPYNLAEAFLMVLADPYAKWCSTYSLRFSDVPAYALLNGWYIETYRYRSAPDIYTTTGTGENEASYLGAKALPNRTKGDLCQWALLPGPITCEVKITGPRGLPYK